MSGRILAENPLLSVKLQYSLIWDISICALSIWNRNAGGRYAVGWYVFWYCVYNFTKVIK